MADLQSTNTSYEARLNLVVAHCANRSTEMGNNQLAEKARNILSAQSAKSNSDLNMLVSDVTILNQYKALHSPTLSQQEQKQIDSHVAKLQGLIAYQIPPALSVLLGNDYQKKYELLKSFGNNLDIIFDMLFDIPPAVQDKDNLYIPAPLFEFVDIVKSLNLSSSDTFIDIGAGFGRINLLVSIMSPAKSIGVEIDHWKVVIAEGVLNSIKNFSNLPTIIEEDAFQFNFNTVSVLFLYHPFEDSQTQALFKQLLDKQIKPIVCTRLVNPTLITNLGYSINIHPAEKTGYYVFNPAI